MMMARKVRRCCCGKAAMGSRRFSKVACGLVTGALLWGSAVQSPFAGLRSEVGDTGADAASNDPVGNAGGAVVAQATDPAKRFLGKGPADLIRELGPPTKVMPSDVKGGKIFIYAKPGQPRQVFETDGTNKIDLAVTVQQ